jgi:hypothetical protein
MNELDHLACGVGHILSNESELFEARFVRGDERDSPTVGHESANDPFVSVFVHGNECVNFLDFESHETRDSSQP